MKQKTQELSEEKSKFLKLKEDFKYNLKLLEERDSDLEKFEQTLNGISYGLFKSYPMIFYQDLNPLVYF